MIMAIDAILPVLCHLYVCSLQSFYLFKQQTSQPASQSANHTHKTNLARQPALAYASMAFCTTPLSLNPIIYTLL